MGWLGVGRDCFRVRLLGGDLKLMEYPTCDSYGCCSGVGGSSTALVLTVARRHVFPRGAAWLSRGEMRC